MTGITGAASFREELLPPARSFYERELGPFSSRPNRRGWLQLNCPFHKSASRRSFSVNVDTGAFRCFGCDARGGDVIDFICLRDKCDFKSAARCVGAWSDTTRKERLQVAEAAQKKTERWRANEEHEKEAKRRRRLALRDEIHLIVAICRKAGDRLAELQQRPTPAWEGEAEYWWQVLALAFEDLRLMEAEYTCACGFAEWELP